MKTLLLAIALAITAYAATAHAGGLLYRFPNSSTTPEQAAQIEQLYYAELACQNATKFATDANAIQQAHATVNADLLAISQWLPLHFEDVLVWNYSVLYQPSAGGTFEWRLR